ncbi:hypothetical protein [Aeromicrobium duanguangcaii]|uniref:DUF5652 domain-containing protein n=1 Tax=Aeromicrobium duanguangcaii TaxID=2968086 RepID=A0ABY5KJC2_9ACTN|nr:hypothetical protein [Aeromicrobium duanguangcaii]MCD9153751.1 hypothetical protein [Aeromicrobium duanguangcaii]UUI69171.1 hypothetical protein NP095_03425 [Aeromicrobium duanguangcaii]
MTMNRWRDLSPTSRKVIIAAGTVDTALKVAALVDLARRPAAQVHGSKRVWAAALVLVNSVGLLPLGYFKLGRGTSAH